MNLRCPSVPLITSDPYFSVWSPADRLYDADTVHWTGKPNRLTGIAEIDGKKYRFMGSGEEPVLTQTGLNVTAFTSEYIFEGAGIRLTAAFTSPNLPDDLYLISRPVSYLKIDFESADGKRHSVKITVCANEELCLDKAGADKVSAEILSFDGIEAVKMGSVSQPVLGRSGDDLRIEWGYFYLAVCGGNVGFDIKDEMTCVSAEKTLGVGKNSSALFLFAYDDIESLTYFGKPVKAYWKKFGRSIEEEISAAAKDYTKTLKRCVAFDERLFIDAVRAGGEKYAELLELACRQVTAAHKLALDGDGELIFISKECFSNGCAATVDVSYPSIPMYLLYNPELVRGMMRPIYKYAASAEWKFDFAPHDVGQYPILNGQVYGNNAEYMQMPVEECGNMLIMTAAEAVASGDVSFAASHIDTLEKWCGYLTEYGADPGNQLCTDDFAGHLAHNCNLTLKAVSGIAGFGLILDMMGRKREGGRYINSARKMAQSWVQRAAEGDGSYRLAYDRPGTWSMKYNIVWDKLFGLGLVDKSVIASECASYRRHINKYGLPLDSRSDYTKSDWLIWTATLCERRADFEELTATLWDAYNCMPDRVPMTDWYFTTTSKMREFQNRTVLGGLFIKLLDYKGKMKKR